MRLALVLALLLPAVASAQSVRYRRPYDQSYRLNYGYDHNGGAGGCVDYACGGSCYDGHTGSDLGAPLGTLVLAAAEGTVISTNDGCANYGYFGNTCGGGCGNYVRIRHGDGSTSYFCHMLAGSIRVSPGQYVGCGQPVGLSASSGSSTGPHLHFGHINPGARAATDPWAGGCSRPDSVWVDQGGYRGPPSPACQGPSCVAAPESCNNQDDDCDGRVDEDVRRGCGTDVGECVAGTQTCGGGGWSACVGAIDPAPERCNRLDDDCDGAVDNGEVCERGEIAWGLPTYGTSHGSTSDVDGDGRADACASMRAGFGCLLSSAHGFGLTLGGGPVTDDLASVSMLRMGDVDGDGRDDVCGAEDGRVVCRRSTGVAFDAPITGPTLDGVTNVELVDLDGDAHLDACTRSAAGLSCALGSAHGFDRAVTLVALSDDAGFGGIAHWGSLRFGDVDGDGRSDACARSADGLDCWRSEGDRFGERILGPRWSDASGFDALGAWSTLRLADIDGDGRDDACIRASTGFVCARSLGRAFGELVTGPAMQGDDWERPHGYATIRMGDVDGDGRADVCARESGHLRCWLAGDHGFDRVLEGPALSDADGFTDASVRFRSLRLADVDGDGRADACARFSDGLRCAMATGHGFDRVWVAAAWADASELNDDARAASIRIGGIGRTANGSSGLVGMFGCSASPARRGAGLFAMLFFLFPLRRRASTKK